MSNIIDSIQLSGVTYDLVGSGGGEGTVSALTETNPVVLKGDYSTYYTATTIDTIYVMSTKPHSFNNYYVMQGETSNSKGFDIIASGDKNGITSIASSTAFTSTVSDGIAKIEFVIPLELRRVRDVDTGFICYYFPPTPYASGSTSDVVEGAVYNSLRQLSLGVMAKDSIASVRPYLSDNGLGIELTTDKGSMSRDIDVSSPTINTNGGKLNTQFSSSTASQVVLNSGRGNYCQMFYSKSYDDLTITFNPSYTGGETSTLFRVKAVVDHNTYSADFTYDITGNSVSYDNNWSTYFTTVDTLSTDHKLKIIPNTGYKIAEFMSYSCMIGGVDNSNPNSFITNLVTTTSNIHDGQEVIDDLYANKQDKLSAGTGINITNNVISATGGGGKAISAGTNISVTTGETADTINCTLPITSGTGVGSIIQGVLTQNTARGAQSHAEGQATHADGNRSHAEGNNTKAGGNYSHAEGYGTKASGIGSHAEGYNTKAENSFEHASGQYNVSNKVNTTFGDSGNTLFSVGNGTENNARHNAFEIRQNGDIYITSGGTDILLQDHLGGGGGGGSSYSAGTGIDITNDVISVSGVVMSSAITTSVTSSSTDAQVPSAKAVYDIIGDIETLLSQI